MRTNVILMCIYLATRQGLMSYEKPFTKPVKTEPYSAFTGTLDRSICFIGADIARQSLRQDDNKSTPLFSQAARITNYQSPFDNALKISNIKRAGLAPRCGRVGLPDDAPSNVVNVHCGDHWQQLTEPNKDQTIGNWTHSWHFHCSHFAEDLAHTLRGDIDRLAIPTRERVDGELRLKVKRAYIPKKERRRIKEWE